MSSSENAPNIIGESHQGNDMAQETSTKDTSKSKQKRKPMKERSDIWNHFTKYTENGQGKCKCNYCGMSYKCNPRVNGTSTYRDHLKRCSKNPNNKYKDQILDDLMAQVSHLRKENNGLLTTMNLATQQYLNMEADNSVLRAWLGEHSSRLLSLNEIIDVLNASTNSNYSSNDVFGNEDSFPASEFTATTAAAADSFMMNQWSSLYLSQPIMASADMFQY